MTTNQQEQPIAPRLQAGEPLHLIFPMQPADASPEIAQSYRHGMVEFERDIREICVQLGFQPTTHHIDLQGYRDTLDAIPQGECIFYLCDGNEQNDGVCGLTPVLYMERAGRPMIAAGSTFWRNTTHKFLMKRLFVNAQTPTPGYRHVTGSVAIDACDGLRYPLFAKPDSLYGSVGISDASVIWSEEELHTRLPALLDTYGGLLVEEFVQGREFTVVVLGDGEVYAMAERRFHESLPSWQRFISYERSWVELAASYPYQAVTDDREQQELSRVAQSAFRAVEGDQYARIDIRQQEETGEFLVLEVNSMPGLGLDGSVSDCARICGKTLLDVIRRILQHA